jgi:hypothetical protein
MDSKIKGAAKKLESINNKLLKDKDETRKQHKTIRKAIMKAEKKELKADKQYDKKRAR